MSSKRRLIKVVEDWHAATEVEYAKGIFDVYKNPRPSEMKYAAEQSIRKAVNPRIRFVTHQWREDVYVASLDLLHEFMVKSIEDPMPGNWDEMLYGVADLSGGKWKIIDSPWLEEDCEVYLDILEMGGYNWLKSYRFDLDQLKKDLRDGGIWKK